MFYRVDLVFAFNSRLHDSTIYTILTHQRHVTRLQAFTAQTGQKRTRLRCLHESALKCRVEPFTGQKFSTNSDQVKNLHSLPFDNVRDSVRPV